MDSRSTCRIRRLFLQPRLTYPLPAAARLLGKPRRELRQWVEAGELEAMDSADGPVVAWEELVSFGMELWSQEAVDAALGADTVRAIPELLQLAELEVRIPRLEIVALERVASREGRAVGALLARELLDFLSAHADFLSAEIPAFAAALAWPESAGAAAAVRI
jgi:hypothetical protein